MKGDTLRGQIDDQDWEVSPDHIYFKLSAESEPEKIEAEQAETFYIKKTNRRFVSRKIGIIDVSKKNVFYSQASLVPKKFEYMFLETVLQGAQASLYKLINKDLESHFYIETPTGFMELGNYSYYREIDGKQYIESRSNYKKQLTQVCSSAPNFKERMPVYTEESLKKYLVKYNACFQEETIVYNSKNRKSTFDPMVGAGVELGDDFGSSITYGFGVRMNLPHKNNKRFIRANMFFTPYTTEFGEREKAKWISLGVGSYFGNAKIQPYFVLGLIDVVLSEGGGAGLPLVMSAGFSYKKILDFEIGHWCIPFANEKKLFYPPSISLRFHPNFYRNR